MYIPNLTLVSSSNKEQKRRDNIKNRGKNRAEIAAIAAQNRGKKHHLNQQEKQHENSKKVQKQCKIEQ